MPNDTSNVVDMPIPSGNSTPLQLSRALLDYIKDKPEAKIIAIVLDPADSSITMGWSTMQSDTMCMMLHFSMFKWEKATFEELE